MCLLGLKFCPLASCRALGASEEEWGFGFLVTYNESVQPVEIRVLKVRVVWHIPCLRCADGKCAHSLLDAEEALVGLVSSLSQSQKQQSVHDIISIRFKARVMGR